jgi:hypothetical protein
VPTGKGQNRTTEMAANSLYNKELQLYTGSRLRRTFFNVISKWTEEIHKLPRTLRLSQNAALRKMNAGLYGLQRVYITDYALP